MAMEFRNMFTSGNALTLAGMAVALTVSFTVSQAQGEQNARDIAKIEASFGVRMAAVEVSVSALSVQYARSDARFDALVASVNELKDQSHEQTALLRDLLESRGGRP